MTAVVGIVMGSDSDWPTMRAAADALEEFRVETEVRVVSAHRTPADMLEYGATAAERGLRVIIAGAGGAAHLPGMLASVTPLPVIGVPVATRRTSMASTRCCRSRCRCRPGVPVATVLRVAAGARNAGSAGGSDARLLSDPVLRCRRWWSSRSRSPTRPGRRNDALQADLGGDG